MCGLIGYTGNDEAAPILLSGLERLSYRGYDSAGMVVSREDGCIGDLGLSNETLEQNSWRHTLQIAKVQGKLEALAQLTKDGHELKGSCGLGHTRWATHGAPVAKNAHPHVSMGGVVAVVHNGIIENHDELRDILMREGYIFASDTDTEVVAHLLERAYAKQDRHNPLSPGLAIAEAVRSLSGSYALGILFADHPHTLYGVCHDNPLCVGIGKSGEGLMASDVLALIPQTQDIAPLPEDVLVQLSPHSVRYFDLKASKSCLIDVTLTQPTQRMIFDTPIVISKGEYPHFMIKEIHEQPSAMACTFSPYLKGGIVDLSGMGLDTQCLRNIERVVLIGCGSAYHAGCVGEHWIENLSGVSCHAELASEFLYHLRLRCDGKKTLGVFISQSGETADTLMVLRKAKELGMLTVGILNVPSSRMAREVDVLLPTHAGVEISVATTKAYTAQLTALLTLALAIGQARGHLPMETYRNLARDVCHMPTMVQDVLGENHHIEDIAKKLSFEEHVFFLGRGIDYALAKEGSLKLKEISYIHAEAYPAGEMKHGSLSLIENGRCVIALATQEHLYAKMKSAMAEVRARGGEVICLTNHPSKAYFEDVAQKIIQMPTVHSDLSPFLTAVFLQLLAYHTAFCRGVDIDRPRHLAKSVTVE